MPPVGVWGCTCRGQVRDLTPTNGAQPTPRIWWVSPSLYPPYNLSRTILTWPIACLDETLIDIMPLFVCATLVSITSLSTRGKGPMASLGGCRAQHAALLRRIGDVQRGSPPQADAEGLVVDSPQDEGCPPTSLIPPPKNGGQGFEIDRGNGYGGFQTDSIDSASGFPLSRE